MAEAAEVDKTKNQGRGADLRSALALLLAALVICHSPRLFAQSFSHVQGAMAQAARAWTNSPLTLALASHQAEDELVLVALATIGCTIGGPSPTTAKAASHNSHTVIPIPGTVPHVVSSGIRSGGIATAVSGGAESPFSAETGAVIPPLGADPVIWGLSPWAFSPRKLMKNGHHDDAWRRRAVVWHVSAPSKRRIHPAKERRDVRATLLFRPCDVPKGLVRASASIQPINAWKRCVVQVAISPT